MLKREYDHWLRLAGGNPANIPAVLLGAEKRGVEKDLRKSRPAAGVFSAYQDFLLTHGRPPSTRELGAAAGCSHEWARQQMERIRKHCASTSCAAPKEE